MNATSIPSFEDYVCIHRNFDNNESKAKSQEVSLQQPNYLTLDLRNGAVTCPALLPLQQENVFSSLSLVPPLTNIRTLRELKEAAIVASANSSL